MPCISRENDELQASDNFCIATKWLEMLLSKQATQSVINHALSYVSCKLHLVIPVPLLDMATCIYRQAM